MIVWFKGAIGQFGFGGLPGVVVRRRYGVQALSQIDRWGRASGFLCGDTGKALGHWTHRIGL